MPTFFSFFIKKKASIVDDINKFISVKIPNQELIPMLHNIVGNFMILGLCVALQTDVQLG